MSKIFLSIIIPAHNEEHRLPASIKKISDFLQAQDFSSEIIVVENGSTDNTPAVLQTMVNDYPQIKVIKEKQRGKGLAVRTGMLAAEGEYRFQADADLSMPIEEVMKFLPPVLIDIPVAIASRELTGSRRIGEPAYRHVIGRIFNLLVRTLALPGLQDTQCGFKCFRADSAKAVFPLQRMNGMSFDAEVLLIARRHGFAISEVPIDWYFDPDSRVHLIKDSLRMALDLFTIRRNARNGLYDPR